MKSVLRAIVTTILLLAASEACANITLPFEAASQDTPIVVVARAEVLGDGSYRLSVIRQVRGDVALGSYAHALSRHLLPQPVDGKSYFVLLDLDMWPWPLSPDLKPEDRVQAFMCGVRNALEIVDDHVVTDDGTTISVDTMVERLKRPASKGE